MFRSIKMMLKQSLARDQKVQSTQFEKKGKFEGKKSPIWRRERESDFLVSWFERRKEIPNKILHRRERGYLFSRFERRTRNFKKDSPLSRRRKGFYFLKLREEK